MNNKRLRLLNDKPQQKGAVVYWMSRDQRVEHNWALLYAQQEALAADVPCIIVFSLVSSFLSSQKEQFHFLLQGLEEVKKQAEAIHISFVLLEGSPEKTVARFIHEHNAGLLVTDFSPLKIGRLWRDTIAKKIDIKMVEVDAHNIVPVWEASQKQEYGAYTLRPKLHKLLPYFVEPYPTLPILKNKKDISSPNPQDYIQSKDKKYTWLTSGTTAGYTLLHEFIKNSLSEYQEKRNDPNTVGQSNLSPYLHFGQISAQEIVHRVLLNNKKDISQSIDPKKNGAQSQSSVQAFLEELIVRRELSDNFCFYNKAYDSIESFPEWSKKEHIKHAKDIRKYIYTSSQLNDANTHDPLWNAAQQQMIATGKMHGYMRMYWAKKILEWTHSAQEALSIAILLNDTYSLDGRDPNGYAGIAWAIGGVHDRPWFERPVYGKIRYMSYNGCTTKFDVEKYIHTWGTKQ